MKIPYNGLPPPPPVVASEPWLDLSDRRLTAAINVLVLSPYAVYLMRGKKPPGWLVAASLGWLAVQFADDLRYLFTGNSNSP